MQFFTRRLSWLWLAALAVTGASLRAADSIGYFDTITSDPLPIVGHQYYTRHCFMYDKGVSLTTNFWRGTLVPINTQVTLVELDSKTMVLRLETGVAVKIKNVEKFSRRDITRISHEMLALQPVPIEKFDEAMVSAIKSGTLKPGMTKEQVVMARGYPPGDQTPSTDADVWMYWRDHRLVQTIVFNDGVVIQGTGIY